MCWTCGKNLKNKERIDDLVTLFFLRLLYHTEA